MHIIDTINDEYGVDRILFRKGARYGIRHINEVFSRYAGEYRDTFYKKKEAFEAWAWITKYDGEGYF